MKAELDNTLVEKRIDDDEKPSVDANQQSINTKNRWFKPTNLKERDKPIKDIKPFVHQAPKNLVDVFAKFQLQFRKKQN
jgi:hypothetical protein